MKLLVQFNGYGIAVIAFLTLTLVIGLSSYRLVKKSSARYMVAGKTLPLFFVGTMLAAQSIDGNASLGAVSLVYQFGFWAGAAIPIGLATCLLFTGLFYGKRLNQMSLLTLPDFYYQRFGSGPEAITSLIMVISFVILVAGNFAASGLILSTVFEIDFGLAVVIPALIVLAYTYAGGLFSSAYTDIFQTYLAIFAFWAAFLFFALGLTGVQYTTILHTVPSTYLDLSGLIRIKNGALANWASILALGLGDIVALDFMERIFASRDGTTARRSAFMGAALTALIIIPISMLGITAVYFLPKLSDPFTAYPRLAMNLVPFPIGALLLMGVLGASMSSANGGLLAISSVISRNLIQRDIMRGLFKKSAMQNSTLLLTARMCSIPIVISAVILAYAIARPGVYLVLAFDIVFAGAWTPLTFGLFWKKSNMPAAITSLVTGSLLRFLLSFVIPPELQGLETMIAPAVSSALFILVALVTQNKYSGYLRSGVVQYVPPERDIVTGDDLRGYTEPTKDG